MAARGGAGAANGHAGSPGLEVSMAAARADWRDEDWGHYRWESLNGLLLEVVLVQIELGIVDSEAALGAVGASQQGWTGTVGTRW